MTESEIRVRNPLNTGVRLVDDCITRSFGVLADVEGNEVYGCPWTDRDARDGTPNTEA